MAINIKYKAIPGIVPSFAEKLIIEELKARHVPYKREVEFELCINPNTGANLRYDFFLPKQNILIEYDGKEYHREKDIRRRDMIKTKFAADNRIKLVRLSGLAFIAGYFKKHFGDKKQEVDIYKKRQPKSRKQHRKPLVEPTNTAIFKTPAKSQADIKALVLRQKANPTVEVNQLPIPAGVEIIQPTKRSFQIKYTKGAVYR